MIRRDLQNILTHWLYRKKILILYGARQVGKTTLAKSILEEQKSPETYFNCEVPSVREILDTMEPSVLKREFGNHKVIVLDEAQNIEDIGKKLKIFADHLPEIQIIATGSSSFELAQKTSEPLTGRALTFTLYPFSYKELGQKYNSLDRRAQLSHWLLYGTYPEIEQAAISEARVLLEDLSSRYLYKDIFLFENIRRPQLLHQLLQLLAFQLGSEVSIHELANTLKINERTVERYLDLLEKAFVIFKLSALSRNLRKEVKKKKKYYFYDLGIRNSIIQQFQGLELRPDRGAIWENFLIVERMKYLQLSQKRPNRYFWRTHDQQEVDYIEEADGKMLGYEFKWKTKQKRIPPAFIKAYPSSQLDWIDTHNFESFILSP